MKKVQDFEVETDIITLFNVIQKKKLEILISGVLCAFIALFYSVFFLKPTFIATSVIEISIIKNDGIKKENRELNEQIMNDYMMLIKSDEVLTKVIENLKLDTECQLLQESIIVEKIPKAKNLKVSIKNRNNELPQKMIKELINISSDYIRNQKEVNEVEIIEKKEFPLKEEKANIIDKSILGFIIGVMLSADYIVILAIYRKKFLMKK